jgi:hypothetical protein
MFRACAASEPPACVKICIYERNGARIDDIWVHRQCGYY